MNVGRITFNNSVDGSNPVFPSLPLPVSPIYFETLSGKFNIDELVGKKFEKRWKVGEKRGEGVKWDEMRNIIDRTYSDKICWSDGYNLHMTPFKEFAKWLKYAALVK